MEEKIKYLKENLSLIIIFPTLIGGIWQLIELSSISVSFIRFFSVSQLIPDGLLILLVFSLFYFAIKFSIYLTNQSKLEKDKSLYKFRIGVMILFAIAFTLAIIFKFIKYGTFDVLIVPVPLMFIIFIIIYLWDYLKSRKIFGNTIYSFIKNPITISFGLIAIILLFVLITKVFHSSFLIPENLKNINKIENYIKDNYPENLENQVLYFNDKFIFIEILTDKKEKIIEVVKFDKLFE